MATAPRGNTAATGAIGWGHTRRHTGVHIMQLAFGADDAPRAYDIWRIWWLGTSGERLKIWTGSAWRTITLEE